MSISPPTQPAPRVIRLAQAGDDPAREELVRYCRHTAYIFALQGCGNRQDAHDVAQDAVVRVLTALGRFRPERPVRPWLLQIVRNLLIDNARRRNVRKTEPLHRHDDLVLEPSDPNPSPEATASQHEQQLQVWKALSRLDVRDREIVTLRDYLDLSYDEIAQTLSIKRGTVMSRLHRARARLRDVLTAGREAHHA